MLSERDKKLLRDYQLVDLKPGENPPPKTWRGELLFRRYLRALSRQAAESRRNDAP